MADAPPNPLLQKWQRNDIYKAIEAAGLDPRQFTLDDSGVEVRIKHKFSKSRFTVGGGPGRYVGFGVIGDGPETQYEVDSWDALISHTRLWLQLVKHDLDTPDLWAELQRETNLLGVGFDEVTENTPFTADEQKEIAERLQGLAKYVRDTYSPTQAQMRALETKLNYLADASGRLGRKDWLIMSIGTIVIYILSAALPPESARTIFQTFLRAIGLLYPELPIY